MTNYQEQAILYHNFRRFLKRTYHYRYTTNRRGQLIVTSSRGKKPDVWTDDAKRAKVREPQP